MNLFSEFVSLKQLIFLLLLSNSLFESSGNRTARKIKVCVIGAGPSGISVTRHLAKNLDKFEITVFEKSSEVGGLWVYTNKTGLDDYGYPIHSSMYENLRTNIPKEIMNFPDWPEFKGVNTSIISHYAVLEYLKNYTDNFELGQFIQFNTMVENVKLQRKNNVDKWTVTVKNLKSYVTKKLTFDVVIVCNGHNFAPMIPRIPGLENFKGKVLHSHDYRREEDFKNKSIIILGAGSSGIDIGQLLSKVASKLYLSHNHDEIPVSLKQIKGIDRFENGKFILKDNSSVIADVLLFCTGYKYSYPFLDDSSGIKVDDKYVSPLYKHIINMKHSSMIFVGLPDGISNFVMMHSQSQFVVSFLKRQAKLHLKNISRDDLTSLKISMKKEDEKFLISWKYIDELAYLGGFSTIPEYYKIADAAWNKHWSDHPNDFKDYNIIIGKDNKTIEIIKPKNSSERENKYVHRSFPLK